VTLLLEYSVWHVEKTPARLNYDLLKHKTGAYAMMIIGAYIYYNYYIDN